MYGSISGMTETDDISYCPKCGREITIFYGDGTAECDECDCRFGVIECGEDSQEDEGG